MISLTSQNGAYDNLEVLYSSGSRNILKQEDSTYNFNPRVPYPEFFYNYGIGNKNHIGSPAGFVFSEFNFQNSVAIKFNKNIEFQALHTYPLWDNYEGLGYNPGYTNLEPVRIEIQKYLREGQKGFEYFQMNYFENIGKNFFSLSFGDLEQMFGGINFQYLYRQPNSFFNFGFDISRVARREFNKSLFNYKKYHVTSAHLNMYFYEPKFEIQGKISYGRYLAKDRGFTFELARKLANGLKYGAFFSLTNLDQYQFGEGSFDKGVFVVIPLDIFEKKRKGYFTNTYRPLTRDGASKIVTNVDIYEATNFSSKYNFRK